MEFVRRSTLVMVGVLVGLAIAVAAPAVAGARPATLKSLPGTAQDNGLSTRLAALATRDLRSASAAQQADRISLPTRGAGSLLRAGSDFVVDVRARDTSDRLRRALQASGARILEVSPRYRTVTAAVAASDLRDVAAVRGVQAVTEELTPMTSGISPDGGAGTSATCTGSRTSEGDTQLQASAARNSFGVSGNGVKVGVLSDSFDRDTSAPTHASGDVATGDLPGPGNPCGHTVAVQKVDDSVVGDDEGRAMAQIVHDLAPGATLAFATAFGSETGFANNIKALRNAGAKVIVDDVTYFDEPFFQNGPVSVAVNQVTAQGATYFSSAANSNVIVGGNNVASWEAPSFRTTTCPAGVPSYATHCMDFTPGAGVDNGAGITVAPGGGFRLDLQWAEPWFGVNTDLDVYVVNSANQVVAASENINPGDTEKPFEFLAWGNGSGSSQTVRIVINKFEGTANPRLKYVLLGAGGITGVEHNVSTGGDVVGPTIFGHNGANNAMSTAAIPFNNANAIETFSSRGPLKLYYGNVNGTTPASPLPSPLTLAKPDVAATDGTQNTFFGSFTGGVWRFFGTSAAAPHAAAVAALQIDGFPSATVSQIKTAQKSTALPVGSFGATAAGHGRVNAKAAVANLLPAVTINNVSATEGNSGTKNFTFHLQLSKASSKATTVQFATANGTATAGSDYVAKTQLVTFPAGTTGQNVAVAVKGDTTPEPNETFSAKLTKPVRMKIADGTGVGTIQNDD
jgi:Calx-beta domain/Subtilase family